MEGTVKPYKVITGSLKPRETITGLLTVGPMVDLSNDTVDPAHLAEGYTAHDANSQPIVGTMQNLDVYLQEIEDLNGDIDTIKQAFTDNGVDVSDIPAEEYEKALDKAMNDAGLAFFQNIVDKRGGEYLFYKGSNLTTIPKIDTSNVTNFSYMFGQCINLTEIPEINTSNGTRLDAIFYMCKNLTNDPNIDFSNAINVDYAFGECSSITSIKNFNAPKAARLYMTFLNCTKLHTIEKINISGVNSSNDTSTAFQNCTALKNITFEGVIKYSNVSFKWSSELTLESLTSIINALRDNTGGSTTTLTIGSTNFAKLTHELILTANDKNWNIV